MYINNFIFILISLPYSIFCFKGFTIDTKGKQVVTTKIQGRADYTSIALTEIGTLIKYKSDSSIVSAEKFSNSNILSDYTRSFMCQYSTNKVVFTRDKKIFEINLNSGTLELKDTITEQIIFLQCDINLNKYIVTYLTTDLKKYYFKINDNSNGQNELSLVISLSSCFLLDSSLVLCINIILSQKKIYYYYHQITTGSYSSNIIDLSSSTFNFYSIQNSMIRYYSKDEILLCLMTKTALLSDISFTCFMLWTNINTSPYTLSIKSSESTGFIANEKINENINYCQIEKLYSDNTYASICLSYYYSTTYLLSIFKYDSTNNKFLFYNNDVTNYKDKQFPLLSNSTISIIGFNTDTSLGIFYKDIDIDSMILLFYLNCVDFNKVPAGASCVTYSDTITNYYFDECTHKFLPSSGINAAYAKYDKNQFCKLKNFECAYGYLLDIYNNDGYYECWKEASPPNKYYLDTSNSAQHEFKKCFRSCLTCSEGGDETNNRCSACDNDNGFYKFDYEASTSTSFNCMHKTDLIEKHYFDANTNTFKKCRKECLTCDEFPSDLSVNNDDETTEEKDTKCTKCNENEGYFPQIDKPSNCIKSDRTDIKYYYYLSGFKRWEKCTDGCKYCTEYGTSIYDTKCNTAKTNDYCDEDKGYYPVVIDDGTTSNPNCFKNDIRYDKYYFDANDKIFKKCNIACLQCDAWGNTTIYFTNTTCLENKCDEKNNYFPIETIPTSCLENNFVPKYYYFDKNIKKFKACYTACATCVEQINPNENNTQCTSCSHYNYYPLKGTETYTNNINCFHKNRVGYYVNWHDNYIYKCPERCSKCVYVIDSVKSLDGVFCTECNNEIGFYELYLGYIDSNNNQYKDCRTWRKEKIDASTDNKQPDDNTILIGNIFKKCDDACSRCTALAEIKYNIIYTHCQAKKCNSGYIYVQNYEDICYPQDSSFPLHFKYHDPILNEDYFKPCYSSCETCSNEGTKRNNYCIECRTGYIKHPNQITNANNCIFNCLTLNNNNYYYLDESKNDEYICVEKCPEEYPYLLPHKKQCLKTCTTESEYKYSKDRICVKQCPSGTTDNIYKECVSVISECSKSDLESNIILNNMDDTNINRLIVEYCQDYSFTSNQVNFITNKLNEYNIYIYKNEKCLDKFYKDSMSFPDLSVCFDEIKKYYDINQKEDLIVMIMNILREDSYTIVEYKIFDSISCQELYIGNCTKKTIYTNIEMDNFFNIRDIRNSKIMYVDKGINVYDRKHPFFTDICYQYTYDGDKDMILEDRVDMYYQDISKICEKECNPEADFDKMIIKCGCKLKEKFLDLNPEKYDNTWNFGINPISVEVMKCSKKAFLWDNFRKNIGNYTALVLIVAEIPVIIYFCVVGLSKVRAFLIPFMGANPPKLRADTNSDENKLNNDNINNNNKDDEFIYKTQSGKSSNNIDVHKINEIKINTISESTNNNKDHSIISGLDNIDKIKTLKATTIIKNEQILFNDKSSDDSLLRKDFEDSNQEYVKKKYDIYKDIIDVEDLNDVELYDAINLDKRKFCQFYYQELKNTQPIFYSFFHNTPLTPKFFKILQFIFNTTFCFFCNAFFYSKYYISKKCFNCEGNFSWYFFKIYDRIIYVCLCTINVSLILRVVTTYKKKMLMWIKREKDPEVFNKEMTIMVKRMKINYIVFSAVQGAFMFFFWLYLSCFCIAYKNNEMEWFVTSWICFGLVQIWYFISAFFITCLRFMGIKCGMESCYNLSICLSFD